MDFSMDALKIIKNKIYLLLGWLELFLKPGNNHQYKYVMDRIEVKEQQGKPSSIIHYKLIGCRQLLSESARELNKLSLFTLFRADHAQMIVSIATAEALIGNSDTEINQKYEKYVSFCNSKLKGSR